MKQNQCSFVSSFYFNFPLRFSTLLMLWHARYSNFLFVPTANRYFSQDFVSICTTPSSPHILLRTQGLGGPPPKILGLEHQNFSRPTRSSSSSLFSSSTPILQLKTPKDPESSSGQSPADLMMSRPMSEESSMWDESESHDVRRRQNRTQVSLKKTLLRAKRANFQLIYSYLTFSYLQLIYNYK